jgi:hypothetical protein
MTKEIPLTQGYVATIDDCDFEHANKIVWCVAVKPKKRTVYAIGKLPMGKYQQRTVYLHRWIMDEPPDKLVDHKDGNGLNCQRENLRVADAVQNGRNRKLNINNTSGFKGVYRYKQEDKWTAMIRVNKRLVYIGLFKNIEDAARAYDVWARDIFGEFAHLNFVTQSGGQ